jgi:hypothetical protein
MTLFTHRRKVRRETEFDRRVRAFMRRALTPSMVLLASFLICALCAWVFCVVYFGLKRSWAREIFPYCVFLAPAVAFCAARDVWRARRDLRLVVAAMLGAASFVLVCLTIYLIICRVNHAA